MRKRAQKPKGTRGTDGESQTKKKKKKSIDGLKCGWFPARSLSPLRRTLSDGRPGTPGSPVVREAGAGGNTEHQ